MGNKVQPKIVILCAVGLLCGLLCGFAAPFSDRGARETDAAGYDRMDVYVDGILTTAGYAVGDEVAYMPVEVFCRALGLSYARGAETEDGAFAAVIGELEVGVEAGGDCLSANGRCFYLPYGVLEIDGASCLPAAELARLVCAQVNWDTATGSIDIDTTHMGALEGGDTYYDGTDLKWLSQIISAESGNQPMEGMMGVGNVVLNRVADPACPDTVYDVIFDTRFGVQFSPVETGGIYCEPVERAVLAAKFCLEGYNVVGDSLFFVNPETGISSWFRETRTFVVTIGDHDFYA